MISLCTQPLIKYDLIGLNENPDPLGSPQVYLTRADKYVLSIQPNGTVEWRAPDAPVGPYELADKKTNGYVYHGSGILNYFFAASISND